ncbi:MAG: SDR family oxidoreductase [Fimbriimonadaceae bacterium]|nr:SDR family oxidoreductase [Fimbriimonadaceae bacterium]
MKLAGKTALVTGAAGWIGAAIARRLADDGAQIVIADLRQDLAQAVADEIVAAGGRASAIATNVRSVASIAATVAAVLQAQQRIDLLVNVAGGSARERAAPVARQSEEVIREILEINLYGVIFCCRAVLGPMLAQGGGRIINITSTLATSPLAHHADYCAAKAGVLGFSRALATEVAPHGIYVNCVSPGLVPRPQTPTEGVADCNYLGRLAPPESVAHVVAFLASDETDFVVGQNYVVDGGWGLGLKGSR